MAQMDARIILAGQAPDVAGSAMNGVQLAQGINDTRRTNTLAQLYQDQGAAMLAGDQGALNALAGIDPAAALGFKGTLQSQQFAQNAEGRAAENHKLALADRVTKMSAAEAAAESEAYAKALEAATMIQTPEQWDAFMAAKGLTDLVGQFDNRDFVIAEAIGVKELLDARAGMKGPADEYKVVGNQLYVIPGDGSPPRVVGTGQTPGAAFEVQTPDGVTLRYGATGLSAGDSGPVPAGQNPDTSATARNPDTLGKEITKADVEYLAAERTKARDAEDMEGLATQIEVLSDRVGYTGPGGEAYGRVDDLIGVLPGDEGARGAFRSLGTEIQLAFTAKTKGAITEREMALFKSASPNLAARPEANALIAQILRAGSQRVQTRATFMEEWANKRGGMQGAEAAWDEYMRANPIIVENGDSIAVNPEGNWREYIGRTTQTDLTPQTILGMTIEQLNGLDVSTMTLEQVDAAQRRYEQLRATQ